MERIEKTILQSLIYNEEYMRKVFPFLKAEYFTDQIDGQMYKMIAKFIDTYNTVPSKEAIEISLQNDKSVGEDTYEACITELGEYSATETVNEFLFDETEKFCKDKAVFNAITRSIKIMDGKDKEIGQDGIPQLLQDALAVAFNSNVGHDYFADAEKRFEFYNKEEERIPFHLDLLNKVTKGGPPKKTLTCILAPTGAGKSLFMTDWASFLVSIGYNVLYITAEMAEERIAERNDANLLDVPLDSLKKMDRDQFLGRMNKIQSKTQGRLFIKEYPTSSAHVGHFKSLLNELKIKQKFVPDIIFVDYINICLSQRYKAGGNANSYTIVKATAEELRGMAVEYNVPVVTATQVNRDGMDSSDIDMTNTSESMGLPMSLDIFFALIPTEELEAMNQIMIKQLKNRFGDINYFKRFVVGIDRSRMRLYDVEAKAQEGITKDSNQQAKDKSAYESEDFKQALTAAKPKPGFDFGSIKF
jgi:replicative DNA helicase